MNDAYHVPVLLDEVVRWLVTDRAGTYLDGTLGGGGHAEAVCRLLSGEGRLVGFDADEEAIRFAGERLTEFAGRITLIHANVRAMGAELRKRGISSVNGILLDCGVSSHQIDAGPRGFSFRSDEPLDMRMDRRGTVTAADLVNGLSAEELAGILFHLGEERASRRIARSICARRPLATTGDLAAAVERAVGGRFLTKSLARVFQALRIQVNGELESLAAALAQGMEFLAPGGRFVVIAYHSLEDRIVKEFFRKEALAIIPTPDQSQSMPITRIGVHHGYQQVVDVE